MEEKTKIAKELKDLNKKLAELKETNTPDFKKIPNDSDKIEKEVQKLMLELENQPKLLATWVNRKLPPSATKF